MINTNIPNANVYVPTWTSPAPPRCPHCGYCPHCGHTPPNPFAPHWNPSGPTITGGQPSGNQVGGVYTNSTGPH